MTTGRRSAKTIAQDNTRADESLLNSHVDGTPSKSSRMNLQEEFERLKRSSLALLTNQGNEQLEKLVPLMKDRLIEFEQVLVDLTNLILPEDARGEHAEYGSYGRLVDVFRKLSQENETLKKQLSKLSKEKGPAGTSSQDIENLLNSGKHQPLKQLAIKPVSLANTPSHGEEAPNIHIDEIRDHLISHIDIYVDLQNKLISTQEYKAQEAGGSPQTIEVGLLKDIENLLDKIK